ncbi:hypothetical protein BX666DRAFT_1858246, partial [Dichotomocladium elegans]
EDTGVIYLGRIPKGFYEEDMKEYFSQFGNITRFRLSRNKLSGASRHYAFIEFESAQVAKIVADTMHNYLLRGRLLQCHVLPKESLHPLMFESPKILSKKDRLTSMKLLIRSHNKKKTPEDLQKKIEVILAREKTRRKNIAAAGIEYEFPGYVSHFGQ